MKPYTGAGSRYIRQGTDNTLENGMVIASESSVSGINEESFSEIDPNEQFEHGLRTDSLSLKQMV